MEGAGHLYANDVNGIYRYEDHWNNAPRFVKDDVENGTMLSDVDDSDIKYYLFR